MILLIQIYYYRRANLKQAKTLIPEVSVPEPLASEETPLISEDTSKRTETQSSVGQFVRYGIALVFVLGTGIVAWAVDQHLHKGQTRAPPEEVVEWKSQVLGWISAVLYSKFD